jgi:hypothetical protein
MTDATSAGWPIRGSFDICNPATMVFRILYFRMMFATTGLSHPIRRQVMARRLTGKIAVVAGGTTGRVVSQRALPSWVCAQRSGS